MFSLRNRRDRSARPPLLLLLALFAVTATACHDLEAAVPRDVPDDSEAVSEPTDEQASEPAADADDADDEAAQDDAAEDDATEDDAAEGVEPITAEDVATVCADEEARAATAAELAPLIGLTPESFESVACSAVEQ